MHLDPVHPNTSHMPRAYRRYRFRKKRTLVWLMALLGGLILASLCLGAVNIPIPALVKALMWEDAGPVRLILLNIRMPQTFAAVVAGAGLACSGAVMQSVLKNPLASPFTLGISHAAAFGAALSVMVLGSGMMTNDPSGSFNISSPVLTISSAFGFSMATAGLIIFISDRMGASPQVMVLIGVALGSLFSAGTMLLQFFADDIQLAAMVFWTFGDLARADWKDLGMITMVTLPLLIYFLIHSPSYNAMGLGDETAKGLGVNAGTTRLMAMAASALSTAIIISFVGIISFIGLVAPHIVRKMIGDDHIFLLPASLLAGGLILLASDLAARLVLQPLVLPVSIFTAFLGAPVFIWMILKGGPK